MARQTKKTTGTKTATRRTKTPRAAVSSEERHRMIAEAAYFKALERDPGSPDPEADWYAAEAEIDAKLMKGTGGSRRAASRTTRKPRARSPRKESTS